MPLSVAVLLATVVPLLVGGEALWQSPPDVSPALLAGMLGMVLAGWNLNALRLRLLLAGRAGRLRQHRALGLVVATEFAICASPAGSGGPVTLLILLARRGLRPARASAIFLIDQCCDLLFFLLALTGIAAWQLAGAMVEPHAGLLVSALAGLVVLLAAPLLVGWRLPALLRWAPGRLPRRRRRALARRLLAFRHALLVTLRLPTATLVAIMLLCAGHWMLRYSLLYLSLTGIGASIAWSWTFLVQMLSMAAGQLSLLPGGSGAAELSTAALLLPFTSPDTAAVAILLWRLVTFHFYLVAGAPVFLYLMTRHQTPQRVGVAPR
ncbi:flippase-like domain-containing protein [Billgrantia azerbaijanica]|nr:flippase-like domain-containing protein [Halomonas azerbaijanica]